jgi:hypothetical protein
MRTDTTLSKILTAILLCLAGATSQAAVPSELYVRVHRAYVHSTEKVVAASCDDGDKLVSVNCFGENVLMEPGEPEHVIALEVAEHGCRLKKHVPDQMVRLEAKTTCAK